MVFFSGLSFSYNTVWYENKKLRVKLARLSSQLNTTNGNLESVIQSTVSHDPGLRGDEA